MQQRRRRPAPAATPLADLPRRRTSTRDDRHVNDIGGADEVHGESGDDTVYTGCGNDIVFGDAQDDDLIVAGWGDDWISGGTGQDGVLGDDGRIFTSRNSRPASAERTADRRRLVEHGCTGTTRSRASPSRSTASRRCSTTDPDTKFSQRQRPQRVHLHAGPGADRRRSTSQDALDDGVRHHAVQPETPNVESAPTQPLYDANNADDVIFGGWDDDFLHGGSGDDAISGAEALARLLRPALRHRRRRKRRRLGAAASPDRLEPPVEPGRHPALRRRHERRGTRTTTPRAALGEFLLYDEYDPRRAILFNDGTTWHCVVANGHDCTARRSTRLVPVLPEQRRRTTADTRPALHRGRQPGQLHASSQPTSRRSRATATTSIFGDLGNDWLVGGTGSDTLWGGWGNDLLNADDDLTGCVTYRRTARARVGRAR